MPVLLQIDSALADAESRTRQLTADLARSWAARGDSFDVVTRDLHADQPPHLSQRAQHWPPHLRGAAAEAGGTLADGGAELDAATAGLQDALIAELITADVVVIGAPMYNYNMASTLKAWVDLVHVPGVTAPFGGPDAPAAPLRGKPVVIITAQGGPLEPGIEDFVTAPLSHLLGTVFGMDVHVVGTSRTLAGMIPELGAEEAAAAFAAASTEAARLGSTLLS
ncbi:FMN-dependent NADH-azoreductase [Leucobacter exalbidus]|uniref:FMN dependent NADH:quinone oxidoreductase n=1 Tax=Leucobacter exalbidus TaxID=662960 RepID=A0A940PNJ2_9MICO|nr:NAD(P)H-dependent oxidoreductase [Leucobacter exalbidus]MBP1326438.1 FMN-dependent NADH-azoreductase [Leucobacter exalbidus]